VGLLHFIDYRSTNDLGAWWQTEATGVERREVEEVVTAALSAYGEVRIHRWGDVVSIELLEGTKKVFSFQIAERSSQLEPSTELPWLQISLDAWNDLVASKMVELIERGTPRDFRDIYAVCHHELIAPDKCWQLWRMKQQLGARDATSSRARLALETHLTRLSQLRPLEKITGVAERQDAESARSFFAKDFLDALVD
jgi:hypothetical protein